MTVSPSPLDETQEDGNGKKRWHDWYLTAVLLGVIAFCFGPGLVGARTLLSVNYLTTRFPWIVNGNQQIGHEACTGDTFDSVMPQVAEIRRQVFSGHLPSWQGLIAGGSPLASLPDAGLLNPLSLPYWVLPLWLAPAFVILFTFVAGVGGTFLFLRRLQIGRPASMLAGLVFATSGFMVMWTNWPQTRVAALIPALFWATERLIQRVRPLDILLVALVVASMLLGGFPSVTGWALYLAVGYFLFRLVQIYRFSFRNWLRTTAFATGGLMLGALLSMVQMLPFFYFYRQHGFSYRDTIATGGLPFSSLVTVFAPNAYGLCVSSTTGALFHGASNPIETVAYLGAGALVLAVAGAAFGIWRRCQHRNGKDNGTTGGVVGYFLFTTILIAVVGWGPTAVHDITAHLPVFSGNFVGRIRSLLGFTVAVLAGVGFDRLTTGVPSSAHYRRLRDRLGRSRLWLIAPVPSLWSTVVWGLSGVAILVVLWRARRSAALGGYWHDFAHAIWIPLLLGVVALLLVVGSWLWPRGGQTALFLLLPVIVAGQGAQFFHTVLPHDSKENFYPVTATHKFLEANLGHDRFASSGGTLLPASALYYGLRTPTGHAFHDPKWYDLLLAIDPHAGLTPTYSDFSAALNQTNIGDQPILDQMGVKYFVLPPGDLTGTTKALPTPNGSIHIGPQKNASCRLPSEPLRGVEIQLASAMTPANPLKGMTVRLKVRDGDRTISSGRFQYTSVPAGTVFPVALAGESLPSGGAATVTLSETGAAGGVDITSRDGKAICSPVTPAPDHLKLVYADPGSVIYQRLSALPRIRWASRSVVIRQPANQIATLKRGIPRNEVILGSASGHAASQDPTISAHGASVSVEADANDVIRTKVHASGTGYLVVADALQQAGWSATVDGRSAKLLPANLAMVAIAVPAGTHVVELHYNAPGQKAGAGITGVALVVSVLMLGWEWRHRRHDRRSRR